MSSRPDLDAKAAKAMQTVSKIKVNDLYYWELELSTGKVYRQWSPDGNETKWKDVENLHLVVRASIIPKLNALPRHDCLVDINRGEKFIRRFCRGFMKMSDGFELKQYMHCIVTNKYRLYVLANGSAMITPHDKEVYL